MEKTAIYIHPALRAESNGRESRDAQMPAIEESGTFITCRSTCDTAMHRFCSHTWPLRRGKSPGTFLSTL